MGLAIATVIATAALTLAGGLPAQAVGPAELSIEITPVNPTTGEVITETAFNQHNDRLAYRIGYSCSVAECTDAVVTLPAVATDPTYGQFRLHHYETWTPPAGGGATITNSETAGITVNLGTLPAGTSATFQVQYIRYTGGSAPNPLEAAYFPPGYQIERSATISSPNATADATAVASPVTWNIQIPTPAIGKVGLTATTRPDTDYTYRIAMSDGCFVNQGAARWLATGPYLCAENFTVVDTLPDQAEFVSATGGGVYDPETHTVTWTGSGPRAAGGWGVALYTGWSTGNGYANRFVTVRFPADAFPEAAGGADFIAPVTNDIEATVTYLDDAQTTKTVTASSENQVIRAAPFGRANQTKDTTSDQIIGGQRFVNVPPDTTGLVCPESGRDDWGTTCTPGGAVATYPTQLEYWQVDTYNRGNVPGVAVITDDDLGDSALRVYQINTSAAATIAVTLSDGTPARATGTQYVAPAGLRIIAATVTSGPIAGPNLLPSQNAGTLFRTLYRYEVPVGAPTDVAWTNTATATMSYPEYPEIADIPMEATATANFRDWPTVTVPVTPPTFGAGFASAPVVEGGGQVVPGGRVTFGVRGGTANIPADRDVSPQYVFIAPVGWAVVPNSASFPAGSVPPGVAYTYKDVTIAGVTRQAVIASWPTGTTFGKNVTWPTMNVVASPTSAVAAGTNSVATAWAGDSRNAYEPDTTTWNVKVVDTTDVDGDGNSTEAFAAGNSAAVLVSGTSRLDTVKEICVLDEDGACEWVSNPDIVAGVDPDATDITYRITFSNGSNQTLSNVVGYDVLPYVGDPRGSTFGETLNEVTSVSPNLELSYSASTNPCRPEVLSTNPGCETGWTGSADGARSIRAALTGTLAPGASASFTFTASVVPGAAADAVACNSVASDSASTLPAEPRPVCATTQEADLAVTVPSRLPLQAERPGVVPFTVANLGPSANAPATVEIDVPAGIRITSLDPDGWVCAADEVEPDGSVLGPVTLSCEPVTAEGTARMLAIDEPNALDLPAVIPSDELVGEGACFAAAVSGLMSDPVEENDTAEACFDVVQGDTLVGLTKDDGLGSVAMGEEFTYTIDVANLLVGEGLSDIVITDELPPTLAFVSASAGGSIEGQGDADADGLRAGGTVTWNLASLAASGQPDADGDVAAGAAGSTQQLTVTVRVVQAAEAVGEIANTATVTTIDPALPEVVLTATDDDVDELIRTAGLTLVKTADPVTVDSVGDVITYSFLATNSGDVTLSAVGVTETAFTGTGIAPAVTCPSEAATLAPAASVTCTATYTVTQADLDAGIVTNTATAAATAPAGVEGPVSNASTATVTAQALPALTLVKSAGDAVIDSAGDTVSYLFLVTNTGNVTLSDVAIDETAFTGTGADVVAECADGVLAPGASVICTASYEVTQPDVNAGRIDNTAVAVATTPTDAPVSSEASSASLVIGAAPALSVVKSATPTDLVVDQEVTYSFVVTNTGNVTLDDVAIDEVEFTGSGALSDVVCAAGAGALDPGDQVICSATYTITQADVDAGTLSNTATATAVAPGGPLTSEPSSVQLPFVQEPGVSVVKSADVDGYAAAGDAVEYRFRVTNTGNVSLADAEVIEQDFSGTGDLSAVDCATGSLLPGQFVDCTADYEVTQADVDAGELTNSATATGVAPGSADPIESELSELVLPFTGELALTLTKAGTPVDVDGDGRTTAADRIQWSFTVTNPSAATLSDVTVVDPMAGEIVCDATVLAPGDSVDCAAVEEYQITAQQAAAGQVLNVASAFAVGVGNVEVAAAEAEAVVEVVTVPPAAAGPGTGGLVSTGVEVRLTLLLGLLALLAGIGLYVAQRRRTRQA
ncbi:putative repeat protein (TIGR01451 family)/fimbrial isopeptide formation D2 family protein [Diaminobutyricimonas aerilata]|uniref:Putative repeat protein (TIGR01451 family)/fimbrial isopeptide formation D2 family protein n=1 Tax=Diaminobutyricimonas aerilata TaxID=1162967 RepID=A0A2M9CMX1_9MICO|nr:isopeptide-forming domain-containing fimbrial protein [Diaminobutyricimonas aerilata]PJJ73235.1 putative repeat protein (TIGR01451 family)/fimbrial isopeptide formation D2 family protein [Diaminobutyricimonas aerilata]